MSDSKSKPLKGQALREINSAISKLRKAGLYAGKAARGQPTAYAKSLVKKFSDVISGMAKAVGVGRKTKEAYSATHKTHGNKVIIPVKPQNEEIVRVVKSKKKGEPDEIRIYGDAVSGARYSRTVTPRSRSKADLLKSQQGPGVIFLLPIKRGRKGTSYIKFDDYADVMHTIGEYVRRSAAKGTPESMLVVRIDAWAAEVEIERTKTK